MICDYAIKDNVGVRCANIKSGNYNKECIQFRCPHKQNKHLEDLADILRKHKVYRLSDYIKEKHLR